MGSTLELSSPTTTATAIATASVLADAEAVADGTNDSVATGLLAFEGGKGSARTRVAVRGLTRLDCGREHHAQRANALAAAPSERQHGDARVAWRRGRCGVDAVDRDAHREGDVDALGAAVQRQREDAHYAL